MKVVLLTDVNRIGQKYDIKEVNDGFAQNFLLPRGLAQIATPVVLKKLENIKEKIQAERESSEKEVKESIKALGKITLNIKDKVSDEGHLFSGIGIDRISDELKSQHNLDIPSNRIVLEKPLKSAGDFEIEVKTGDKSAKFKLIIEAS